MFLVLPIGTDVSFERRPIGNWLIIGVCVLAYASISIAGDSWRGHPMVLHGWTITGLLGHAFLHGGILHLIGNMIFLWVFGNAIAARLGAVGYVAAFMLLAVLAGAGHVLIDGAPAVGASGAINGLVGMFLVLYPREYMRLFVMLGSTVRTYEVRAWWVILMWFAADLIGAMLIDDGVAYIAHLAGFVAGGVLMATLIKSEALATAGHETTVFDL